MSLTMTYEIRNWDAGPQAHVVTAAGELDLHAAPALRETLVRVVDLGRIDLIVDMSDATFVDSTIIGVLVGRLKVLRRLGGSLTLVCADENVLRTFEIGGIERAFAIHETLAGALVPIGVPS